MKYIWKVETATLSDLSPRQSERRHAEIVLNALESNGWEIYSLHTETLDEIPTSPHLHIIARKLLKPQEE